MDMFCSLVWRSGDLGWRKGPQCGRQLKSKAPVRMQSAESEEGVDPSEQKRMGHFVQEGTLRDLLYVPGHLCHH